MAPAIASSHAAELPLKSLIEQVLLHGRVQLADETAGIRHTGRLSTLICDQDTTSAIHHISHLDIGLLNKRQTMASLSYDKDCSCWQSFTRRPLLRPTRYISESSSWLRLRLRSPGAVSLYGFRSRHHYRRSRLTWHLRGMILIRI
jgi:hypothetical protein